jgi:hypothetical protein
MSVIGNEFSGLPIADLIGGPLKAACDAQIRLAKATADFINTVGFNPVLDANNKPTGKLEPKQIDFSFWQPLPVAAKEVLATGTLTLSGTATTADKITNVTMSKTMTGATTPTVVEILGVTVPFNTSLEQTAADVASQINRYHSTPAFTATANGKVVTITASPGSGASGNGWQAAGQTGTGATLVLTGTLTGGGVDGGGDSQVQKVVLSVPFLAIVNVPALMVKTVDITFDMEVKSSESHKDELSEEASMDASVKIGWGPVSAEVKIHGAISAHQENTRSTDRSAKYHIQVHASDDGMPEGLSRVLDMLQKAIAPVSVSKATALSDANIGKAVTTT